MTYVPPSHWTIATVGDIAEVSGGLTKNAAKRDASRVRAPLVSVAAVQLRSIDESAIGEVGVLDSDGDRATLEQGDLLVVEGNGSLEHIGRVALWNVDVPGARHQNHIIRVRPREMPSKFLLEWLASPRGREAIIQQATSASGLYTLSLSKVERLLVPVPPLNEQRRIVAKLDAVFEHTRAAKARLERLPALLDKLKRSILAAAFRGDLTASWRDANPSVEPASALLERIRIARRAEWENQLRARGKDPTKLSYEAPSPPRPEELPPVPDSWSWSSLDELRRMKEPLCYGVVQPGEEVQKDGVALVRVCDLDRGTVLVDQLRTISAEVDEQYARSRVKGGEILISVVGTIGRIAIVPLLDKPANIARAVARLVPAEPIDPRWLRSWLSSTYMETRLGFGAREVARATLNIDVLRDQPVPVAPIEEMKVIIDRIDEAFSVIDSQLGHLKPALSRVVTLEQAALAKAFRGELVEQDSSDEPASTLVERLRAFLSADTDKRSRGDSSRASGKSIARSPARTPHSTEAER